MEYCIHREFVDFISPDWTVRVAKQDKDKGHDKYRVAERGLDMTEWDVAADRIDPLSADAGRSLNERILRILNGTSTKAITYSDLFLVSVIQI